MTIIRDDVDPANVAGWPAVLGYLDGDYKWSEADVKAHERCILLSVLGVQGAEGYDFEKGNAPLGQVVTDCHQAVIDKRAVVIYAQKSNVPVIESAGIVFEDPANYPATGIYLHDADWTGNPHCNAGSLATQYANPKTSGGQFDLSFTINPNYPPLTGAPAPSPTPPPAPAPVTPTIINTWTNSEGIQMSKQEVPIDVSNGFGWEETTVPFDNWNGAAPTLNGMDPNVDGVYLKGSTQAQERNGHLFITLTDVSTSAEVETNPNTLPAGKPWSGTATVFFDAEV